MTYIESALGDFIKTILTRGIKTLKSPRFLPYTIFMLVFVISSTLLVFYEPVTGEPVSNSTNDLLLFAELSAALTFIIVGIFLSRRQIAVQVTVLIGLTGGIAALFLLDSVPIGEREASNIAAILYVLWIAIFTFSTFSLFKDLFAEGTSGTILFLGKPEDDGKVMFSFIAWILVVVNIGVGYFIYTTRPDSTALQVTAIIIIVNAIIATLPLFGFQKENDVFYTILSSFFMFTTIRVILLAFKALSSSGSDTSVWDTVFSLFIALYAVQGAAVKGIKIGGEIDDDLDEEDKKSLEERLLAEQDSITGRIARALSDRGVVLIILGIVLGFHTLQVQTQLGRSNIFSEFELTKDADIVLLSYELNLAISLIIYVFSLIFFFTIPRFRSYANPEIKRIQWLPPYDELKEIAARVKAGDVSMTRQAGKLVFGMGKDYIASKFGRKSKSKEERISGTFDRLRGKDDK